MVVDIGDDPTILGKFFSPKISNGDRRPIWAILFFSSLSLFFFA